MNYLLSSLCTTKLKTSGKLSSESGHQTGDRKSLWWMTIPKIGTREILQKLDGKKKVRVILHERNQGKGAAVVTGLKAAKGDVLLIQDADLEYDPRDYPLLLQPINEGIADVVYGSRFLGGPHRVTMFWHLVANRLLTS